jgi:hypothetical protein
MRALLISANTERINMPTMPLGLALVAAATRRSGHETELLDLLFEPDPAAAVRGAIEAYGPDVIGISVRNVDDQEMTAPGFLLLGGPGETRETVEESLTFARSLDVDRRRGLTSG